MKLARTITKRRTDKGWSRIELASRVGVTRISIYNWESGVKRPSWQNQKKLARVFQISVKELLTS